MKIEKVIDHVKNHLEANRTSYAQAEEKYRVIFEQGIERGEIILAALIKQESKEPIITPQSITGIGKWNDYTCPDCGTLIEHRWKHCRECGQAIKWD